MVNTVPSDYITGTITLTNGSAAFTGTGTGWLAMMFRQGDMILDLPDAPEYIAIIDEVTTNTAGTLTRPWLGPTLTGAYRMRYQWDAGRVTAMSAFLREELGNGNLQAFAALVGSAGGVPVFIGPGAMEVRPATDFVNGVAYDVQVDTLADRAAFDGQLEGFAVLVSNVGDGRSALYSKASNTVGDWTDPAYITGPIGAAPNFAAGTTTTVPPGTPADVDLVPDGSGGYLFDFDIPAGEGFIARGPYSGATAYNKGDVVQNNGSSWIAKIATTGNAPPTLPTTSNTWWELLAAKGLDGTGTGDVVGPASAVADRIAVFDGTTGKLIKDGGLTIAEISALVPVGFSAPQGRLTLTSNTPVTETDIAGATTVYYTACVGSSVPVFDGTKFVSRDFVSQISLALTSVSGSSNYHEVGKNFDFYAYYDGTNLLLGTGPAWTSDTARGTGAGTSELESLSGVIVNKNAMRLRTGNASGNYVDIASRRATYLGSARMVANGQTSDTRSKRLLFNAYNQALRVIRVNETIQSWTYSIAAWRQANANVNNRIDILNGLAGSAVDVDLISAGNSSTVTSRIVRAAIGLDSTTSKADGCPGALGGATNVAASPFITKYSGYPGLGFHFLSWLEWGAGTDTQTFFGKDVTNGNFDFGMYGTVLL